MFQTRVDVDTVRLADRNLVVLPEGRVSASKSSPVMESFVWSEGLQALILLTS
jgi:hypothetical protein